MLAFGVQDYEWNYAWHGHNLQGSSCHSNSWYGTRFQKCKSWALWIYSFCRLWPTACFPEPTTATSKHKQFHIYLAFTGSPKRACFGKFLLVTKENIGWSNPALSPTPLRLSLKNHLIQPSVGSTLASSWPSLPSPYQLIPQFSPQMHLFKVPQTYSIPLFSTYCHF